MSRPITTTLRGLPRSDRLSPRPALNPHLRLSARRPFSATAHASASQMGRAIMPQGGSKRAQPSFALARQSQMREAMASGQMPNDMGLIAMTFIRPRGEKVPGLLTRERRRLEWTWLKQRVVDFFATAMYVWKVRPMRRLEYFSTPRVAQELHREVYTAFAEGTLAGPVEAKVCESFLTNLRFRAGKRAKNTSLRWRIHAYLERPRVVSYKALVQPGPKGELSTERSGIIQAVVRIRSLQSLQHVKRISGRDAEGRLYTREITVDAQGREVPAYEEGIVPQSAKESTEYVVVQRRLNRGKIGPWMIWGTAEETTAEGWRRELKKAEVAMKQAAAMNAAA